MMDNKEQTIKDFYGMDKLERDTIVRKHHNRNKRTIRETAKDFNISVGTAFNCVSSYD